MPRKKQVVDGESRWPAEIYRAEIEERTRNGESCLQISQAIESQYNVQLHMKTISRKRCEWGLRTRAQRAPNKNPSIRKRPVSSQKRDKYIKQTALKAEITTRTEKGETAQQITDAVIGMGFELKSGVATVLRLQTFWGLIPYDQARATKGSLYDTAEYRERRKVESRARSKKLAKERAAAAEAAKAAEGRLNGEGAAVVHYPTNCTFGPGRRLSTTGGASDPMDLTGLRDEEDHDDGGVYISPYAPTDGIDTTLGDASAMAGMRAIAPAHSAQAPDALPAFSYTRDIMSANLMVDLAISMLSAAKDVKDLMIAGEIRRPASNSITGLPPSHEEVVQAKRKLKEATRCAWDLAKDGVLGDV